MIESWVPIKGKMDKENAAYVHNGVLFIHKEKWDYFICNKMDGPEYYNIK